MKWAYYNEHDAFAAEWLRELIKSELIAPGEVDERSIEDVCPTDLRGYAQCHFFAGIGVWSYALRLAGWPDDRPAWTGSCPCQPFSAAGKGGGFADERHLWPAFHHLVRHNRPDTVMGEQVAGKDGLAWLDLVHADMEADGYTFGALDLCAAGFGAPHIRQRLYWRADAMPAGRTQWRTEPRARPLAGDCGTVLGSADDLRQGPQGRRRRLLADRPTSESGASIQPGSDSDDGHNGRQDSDQPAFGDEPRGPRVDLCRGSDSQEPERELSGGARTGGQRPTDGITRGFWADAEWLVCRDGKYRPVEPVLQPVADGFAGRLGLRRVPSLGNPEGAEVYHPLIQKGEARAPRLRGYGNAIAAEVARAFIEATEGT